MTSIPAQIPPTTESTFLVSPRNPNDNKNRVPTLTELKGLRKLMESNLHVDKVLEDEVARLKSSQKALSERLIRQQLDLEATQSELFETNNLIESLGLQRSALQGRTRSLRALIHPIRRLPVEIWKHVFELTVEISDDKIQEATKLSSICRSWREIALDTPRLWCTITTDASSISKEPWDHWVVLMRSNPANICITDIGDGYDVQDGPLSKIPNLSTLALELVNTTSLHNLFTGLFGAQYQPLDDLSISLEEDELLTELPLDSLTAHFPSLVKLTLTGSVMVPSQESSQSRLVSVSLKSVDEVDFYSIFLLFPLLENLELVTVTLAMPSEPPKVTSNSIRRLSFYETPIFDLAWVVDLRFPRLKSLVNGSISTPLFLEFVKSHPSISELDCVNDDDQLMRQASSLPPLTYLSVTAGFNAIIDWRQSGLQEAPFPSLHVLMFGRDDDGPEVPEFEGIVRARCLPKSHPKSLLEHEALLLGELRVLVADRKWESEAWALHELAQEASREIIPYEEEGGWYYVVLRWNSA